MLAGSASGAAPTLQYNHGNPTADEQVMLEFINRARMAPPGEGGIMTNLVATDPAIAQAVAQFGVDMSVVRSDFNSYPAIPPLAWNAKLLATAREHATDMSNRNYQGHTFPPSNDPGINQEAIRHRIEDVFLYDWASFGFTENVFASQDTQSGYFRLPGITYAHAGFLIEWGVPTLFHRNAIMGRSPYIVFREIGIGVVETSRSTANAPAFAISQDLGVERPTQNTPFLTGVVYTDNDQTFSYTKGEGQAGVTVTPEQGRYFAVTGPGGGYSLPLLDLTPGTSSIRVTFSGGPLGATTYSRDIALAGTDNRKLDLRVPVTGASSLVNLSTRLRVETGVGQAIAGFVVSGDRPKRVLVRALGPTLIPFGIPTALPDPRISLRNSGGSEIASNDDWQSVERAAIEATGFAPPNTKEPALIATLTPGSYTAIISGNETAPNGVSIIEVYDLDASPADARAINVSTRGKIGTATEVMIGGFVIGGTQPRQVVIRAIGPSLIPFGITGAVTDPVLELFRGPDRIRLNDNWRDDPAQAALIAKGYAPTDNREAAFIVTLAPGSYTAVVSGAGGASGIGLIEVYDAP